MNEPETKPRTPLVVWLLVAAIVAAYVAFYFAPLETKFALERALALTPARYHSANPLHYATWYEAALPIVGHAFLHAAWWHVGLNALFLVGASRWVALRMGAARYLVVFFASVVGGALVFLALNWNGQDFAVGASGGVCGMFSAFFLAARPTWRDALADPRTRNPLLMLIFLNVVVMAVVSVAGVLPIAWEGHLGGFIGGALAYIALEPKPRGPWA